MVFNMSKMTIMKVMDPKKWQVAMRKGILQHRGVALHVAQDMGIGISTLKRWVEEDDGLTTLMANTRKAHRKTKAA